MASKRPSLTYAISLPHEKDSLILETKLDIIWSAEAAEDSSALEQALKLGEFTMLNVTQNICDAFYLFICHGNHTLENQLQKKCKKDFHNTLFSIRQGRKSV